jgi:hypothetical protein
MIDPVEKFQREGMLESAKPIIVFSYYLVFWLSLICWIPLLISGGKIIHSVFPESIASAWPIIFIAPLVAGFFVTLILGSRIVLCLSSKWAVRKKVPEQEWIEFLKSIRIYSKTGLYPLSKRELDYAMTAFRKYSEKC